MFTQAGKGTAEAGQPMDVEEEDGGAEGEVEAEEEGAAEDEEDDVQEHEE